MFHLFSDLVLVPTGPLLSCDTRGIHRRPALGPVARRRVRTARRIGACRLAAVRRGVGQGTHDGVCGYGSHNRMEETEGDWKIIISRMSGAVAVVNVLCVLSSSVQIELGLGERTTRKHQVWVDFFYHTDVILVCADFFGSDEVAADAHCDDSLYLWFLGTEPEYEGMIRLVLYVYCQ